MRGSDCPGWRGYPGCSGSFRNGQPKPAPQGFDFAQQARGWRIAPIARVDCG